MFKPIPPFATISLYYNIICTICKQTTIDIYYIVATQYAAVQRASTGCYGVRIMCLLVSVSQLYIQHIKNTTQYVAQVQKTSNITLKSRFISCDIKTTCRALPKNLQNYKHTYGFRSLSSNTSYPYISKQCLSLMIIFCTLCKLFIIILSIALNIFCT